MNARELSGGPNTLLVNASAYLIAREVGRRSSALSAILEKCPLDFRWWTQLSGLPDFYFAEPELDARFHALDRLVGDAWTSTNGLFHREEYNSRIEIGENPQGIHLRPAAELAARQQAVENYPEGKAELQRRVQAAMVSHGEKRAADRRLPAISQELWTAALLLKDHDSPVYPPLFRDLEKLARYLSGSHSSTSSTLTVKHERPVPTIEVLDTAGVLGPPGPCIPLSTGPWLANGTLIAKWRAGIVRGGTWDENECALERCDKRTYLLRSIQNDEFATSALPLLLHALGDDLTLLRDPEWQEVLQMCLFRVGKQTVSKLATHSLATDLKDAPLLAPQLVEFVCSALEFYRSAGFTEDIESALFILRISRRLRPYLAPYVDLAALPNDRAIGEWKIVSFC